MTNPLIIVGMPRSGSTLFTRILNESPDLFIVNDFYYLQQVDAVNGFKESNSELSKYLAQEIFKKIQARIEKIDSPQLECGLFLSPEAEKKIEKFAQECGKHLGQTWSSLLEEIMQYSAELLGKKVWGYNTPQDYLHIERLQQVFPYAKFIFVMRDPRCVIRSYKYVQSNGYHEVNRYHPLLQALAWRTSIRSFLRKNKENPHHFLLIRYEDLVADVNKTLIKVSEFTQAKFPRLNLEEFGNNSSFQGKHKRELLPTEIWLCEIIAGEEIRKIGYSLSTTQPQWQDISYISYITIKMLGFYLQKGLFSSDMRQRIFNVANAALNLKS
jgi:hypothetical protein